MAELIERRRAIKAWTAKDGQSHISEYAFHLKGKPIGEFRKTWAKACCAAGVGSMVGTKYVGRIFHDLRRTAARNMVAAGVPPQVAMKITGHRTDAMFRRYAIVNEEQKRDALARTRRRTSHQQPAQKYGR